jgi:hypothetical protein
MSLILKQEPANTIATPPAGKSTLFVDDNSVMAVKSPAGVVTTFPTVQGSNTQVFFNDQGAINGSANLSFVKTTNTLTLTNGNVVATGVKTDNLYYANGNPWDLQQPAGSTNQLQYNDNGSFGASANLTFNGTSLNTTANLNVTGNAYISGNLTVDGNVVYVNVESLSVEDPLISLGGGPNGNALTSNNGYDRGLILHNYTTQTVDAFMGWDTSNAEFSFASNVTVSGEVVTINTLGNVRANNIAGTLSTAAQPNITSVGTLTGLLIGATALQADFPNAKAIISQDNSGQTHSENIGVVGEAVANSGNANIWGIGVLGEARANGATKATGVQGGGYVTNSTDTGAAVGVRGYSIQTHSGGYNIGVLGNAAGSGLGNYAFYVQAGNIGSIETTTNWELIDDEAAALTFSSTGKANIFGIETTDGAEGIYTQGYLNVTGNAAVGGVKTDNYYYANGSPVDFQQAGGSNAQIQFNDNDSFGGSAAFTFNKTSNVVQIGGVLSVVGNANIGNIGTGGLITATGNIGGGNINTGGAVSATGNVTGGNLTTGGLITATGNITGANLITGGIVSATGNGTFGNVSTGVASVVDLNVSGNVTSALLPNANVTYDLGSDTQRWRDLYLANTTIYLGNANIKANGTAITMSGNTTAANLLTAGILSVGGNANVGNLGTAGLVVATGNVTGGNLVTSGALSVTGNANVGNIGTGGLITATGNVTGGNLNTSGNVNSSIMVNGGTGVYLAPGPSGYINFFTTGGDKASVTDTGNIIASNLIANSTVFAVTANISGNVNAGNVSGTLLTGTLATAAQPNITSVGTLTSVSVSGNANVGNIGAAAGVFTTVAGSLTTAAQPNITSVGTLTTVSVSGNANVGNLGTGGLITATGNVSGGNLTTGGLVSATGNIATNANLVTDLIVGRTTGVSITATGTNQNINLTPTGTGSVNVGNFIISNVGAPVASTDAATKQYVDDVAQGLHTHDACNAATTGTLATISGGVVTYNNGTDGVGATLTTTGSYTTIDNVTLSNGMRILVKNEANTAHNGIYDRTSSTVLTRSSDFDTPAEMAGGDFTFVNAGTLYDNTGWVMPDPVTTVGTSPVVWVQFSGAGTYTAGTGLTLTGSQFSITNTAVTAGSYGNGDAVASFTVNGQGQLTAASNVAITANAANLSGTTLKSTVVTSSLTSVGTLTTLSVSGNANVGNIGATTFVGALSGAATTAGTVTTAAQPNITSVGTLTSLGVNGTVTAVAFTANTGVFTGNGSGLSAIAGANVTGTVATATNAGTVTSAAQANITSVSTSFTGLTFAANGQITMSGAGSQISGVNLVSANSFSGNGSSITGINASSIASGTLAQARLANSSLTVNGTAISLGGTGTITATATNALTIGTGLGGTSYNGSSAVTITNTGVTSISAGTNIAVSAATGGVTVSVTGTVASATTAGTVTTAAQPNITSVGTLTSLTLGGTLTSAGQIGTGAATHFGTTLTTGANSTAGTITGNWTLSAGSRLNATYADLAEKYTADADYEPGTVLVFGGEHEVTLSTESDSFRVAGVVTTNPAYTMNNGCEGEHVATIALQGRVPCKVIGPVFKGDLLVSTGNGYATANNIARAGTIIGKSLENFTGASGIVEVAVGRF